MPPAKPALGFGITAGLRPWLSELGERLEALGYAELWANDSGGRSGLATLHAAATRQVRLGVGVIPLSDRSAVSIADEARALDLPHDRLIAGIGSGRSRSLELVRRGAAELRQQLPAVQLAVAAVGPRMCRLAGEVADVVLLNWATPPRIEQQRLLVEQAAQRANRPVPTVAAYVRVAIGEAAGERLREEQERYAGYGDGYRRAMDEQRGQVVGVAASDETGIRRQLASYQAVLDRCIVRGLPAEDSIDEWLHIAEAAA